MAPGVRPGVEFHGAAVGFINERGVIALIFVCPCVEQRADLFEIVSAMNALGFSFLNNELSGKNGKEDSKNHKHHQNIEQRDGGISI